MHLGTRLIGVLALGKKRAGAAYERQDFIFLQSLVALAGPFLVQAGFTATLERVNDYVFQQNRQVSREKRDLEARLALHNHLLELISPDLRQPLLAIAESLGRPGLSSWHSPVGSQQSAVGVETETTAWDEVRSATQRLRGVIERLIALATLVREQRPLGYSAVQLEDVVEEAVRGLATMAGARRVEVVFNRATTLPLILTDAAQLQTAIHHLLHNGIKFNRIGGKVTLDVGLTDVDVYLRIVDTGVGMPAEKVNNLWQGFVPLPPAGHQHNGQLAGPAATNSSMHLPTELSVMLEDHRPLGRGLIIAQTIIAAHGGRLEAQSVYGRGSTFTLYLPLDFEVR
jgi:signal transduction histidine kinase